MKRAFSKKLDFFVAQGRLGGLKRSRGLSPSKRSLIATKAARARWQSSHNRSGLMSIRLDNPQLDSPVFLEELLSEGSLAQWHQIYQKIANEPFGVTADALQQVLAATSIYGVTALWGGILKNVRSA